MANRKGGLGKGFGDLFIDNSADALSSNGVVELPISEIEPDRSQPRQVFDENALSELENSIREYGVLQPLLVRPVSDGSYKIVAGERRWRAARSAGLSRVPVIIKALSDSEAAAIALIENLQREDLNAIEEAEGIRKLMDEYGFTQEETSEKLSKSRSAVANSLRLLSLPAEIKAYVVSGELSAGHARTLLGLNNADNISAIADRVIREKLSVRQTEALVKQLNKPVKARPVRKLGDKELEETALALSSALGRNVKITGNEKGGKLEIEFFDKEDLKKLAASFADN